MICRRWLDGLAREVQHERDLFGALALCHQLEHLPLPWGKRPAERACLRHAGDDLLYEHPFLLDGADDV